SPELLDAAWPIFPIRAAHELLQCHRHIHVCLNALHLALTKPLVLRKSQIVSANPNEKIAESQNEYFWRRYDSHQGRWHWLRSSDCRALRYPRLGGCRLRHQRVWRPRDGTFDRARWRSRGLLSS